MLKKYLVLSLTVLTINLFLSVSIYADTKESKEAKLAAKVKSEISKLGSDSDARVEVKLRDKKKLKGYVSQINENSFVLVNEKTGTPTEVPYTQTKQVKGNNLSTGVKIAIVIAGVIAVVALIGFFAVRGS